MKIEKRNKKSSGISFNLSLLLIFAILFVTIGIINHNFFNPNYIINVMIKNIIEIGLIALPLTLIIITSGIDLSVGSIMILSAISGGMVATAYGDIAGIVVGLIVGVACGYMNGLVVAKLKISPLITTLATMFLFRGIAKGITAGDSVYTYGFSTFMGNQTLLGLPISIIIFVIMAIAFYIILSKTTLGRSLLAIGNNENATRYSGINVNNILILIYTLCGLICAIAGYIYLGRFTSVKYDVANSLNLQIITVVVLGGTNIMGGSGDMKGTIIATLIIAVLNSGLTVLNIPVDAQTIINGVVLIISLIVYSILNEMGKNKRIINVAPIENAQMKDSDL
jgi:ribose transport system permease protein/rhamnose transport system permease protein